MKISNFLLAACAATLLMTGCAKNAGPAKDALDKIHSSLEDVKADAAKYAPDGLKGVELQYDRLKASLDAKDYDNVLAGTPSLQKAVDSLKDAVDSGKEHAKAAAVAAKTEWESLSVDVPKMVAAIQSRVDELSKKKHLPLGMSKDEFEGSKSVFDSMKSTWADASKAADEGHPVEASNKAKTAKGMGEELYDRLKIKTA